MSIVTDGDDSRILQRDVSSIFIKNIWKIINIESYWESLLKKNEHC